MKRILLAFIFAFSQLTWAQLDPLSAQPRDLLPGSKFHIVFDPELLEKKVKEWRIEGFDPWVVCSLTIKSHFDKELARELGSAEYSITETNYGMGQSSIHFRQNKMGDHFTIWMTTENKSLSLLVFDCFFEKPSSLIETKWTLSSVERFISQPGFFKKPVLSQKTQPTAIEMLSSLKSVRTLVPLRFVNVKNENGRFSLHEPKFVNGEMVEKFMTNDGCRFSYRMTNYREIDLTIPSNQGLKPISFIENTGHIIFQFEKIGDPNRLDLTCNFSSSELKSFSDIEAHIHGIIDFRK